MPLFSKSPSSLLLLLLLLILVTGVAVDAKGKKSKKDVVETSTEVEDENERCFRKIRSSYPNATCSLKKDKAECKQWCERVGTSECLGRKGEIRKLNCKKRGGDGGGGSGVRACCCTVSCESDEAVDKRLDEALNKNNSVVCVKGRKGNLRQLLSKACRQEDKVHVAKKYCTEEKRGTYYCLTEGMCVGQKCQGCVNHECEVDGKSEKLAPPAHYMKRHLAKLDFDRREKIDVDSDSMSEWCSTVPDSSACNATCQVFGERWCGGPPMDLGVNETGCQDGGGVGKQGDDDDEEGCTCCCQPSCDPKKKKVCTFKTTTEVKEVGEMEEGLLRNGTTKSAEQSQEREDLSYDDNYDKEKDDEQEGIDEEKAAAEEEEGDDVEDKEAGDDDDADEEEGAYNDGDNDDDADEEEGAYNDGDNDDDADEEESDNYDEEDGDDDADEEEGDDDDADEEEGDDDDADGEEGDDDDGDDDADGEESNNYDQEDEY